VSEARTYRAGDVVRHRELGEEWSLACDERDGRIAACGWPEGWTRVEEVELVEAATDEHRLEVLTSVARDNRDSRGAAARAQLAAAQAETPLDAIARRAKALGWAAERSEFGELNLLAVTTQGAGIIDYRQCDGVLFPLVGTTGHVCGHERALLGSDGEALDALRALHGQLAQAEALCADMRSQIERLTALVTGGGA
jgi:hypothetical protein